MRPRRRLLNGTKKILNDGQIYNQQLARERTFYTPGRVTLTSKGTITLCAETSKRLGHCALVHYDLGCQTLDAVSSTLYEEAYGTLLRFVKASSSREKSPGHWLDWWNRRKFNWEKAFRPGLYIHNSNLSEWFFQPTNMNKTYPWLMLYIEIL